ncbi:hypothetical protein BGX21_003059 [Mortierella sp. AD011]|nr:hypothetical protein BGX21_003059 [Mortierella sp. AD011]
MDDPVYCACFHYPIYQFHKYSKYELASRREFTKRFERLKSAKDGSAEGEAPMKTQSSQLTKVMITLKQFNFLKLRLS